MTRIITEYFLICALLSAMAGARQLSIPEYLATPGGAVEIPVHLDDASGLSSIEFQVNYDTALLTLISVTEGDLGKQFEELIHEADDGVITLALASAENLVAGSGNLALLNFEMREGSEAGLYAEVAIASYSYSDSSGVLALHQKERMEAEFGKVTASNDPMIDNAGNGLPDWWERLHSLDLFQPDAAHFDSDGDGLVELLEFGLVRDPNLPDSGELAMRSDRLEEVGSTFLTLTFTRRIGLRAPVYTLLESDDMNGWWDLDFEAQVVSRNDHGDGTETVVVKGSVNVESDPSPVGFLTLEVD